VKTPLYCPLIKNPCLTKGCALWVVHSMGRHRREECAIAALALKPAKTSK
jgi:hypothetical protein